MKEFFKRYLISGVLVIVPLIVTVWVLKAFVLWIDGLLFSLVPASLRPENLIGYKIPGIGFILVLILTLLAGAFVRFYLGRKIVAVSERILRKVPFGGAIYHSVKSMLGSLFSGQGRMTARPVLVRFFSGSTYVIGFVFRDIDDTVPVGGLSGYVSVFVPTTPNPTSGFLVFTKREEITPLDLTLEEATRLIMSGGLLTKSEEENLVG